MNNMNEQLRMLKNENLIWIIYIFISISAIVSNHFEKQYDLTNDSEAYKKFKTIITIAFFIYLYFFITIFGKLKKVRKYTKKYHLTQAQLLGALLFLIGGLIYLIVEISEQEEAEIAFI